MSAREELFSLWQQYGGCFESDSSEGWELADAILAEGWVKIPVLLTFAASLREEAKTAEVWDGNNQAVLERVADKLEKLLGDE